MWITDGKDEERCLINLGKWKNSWTPSKGLHITRNLSTVPWELYAIVIPPE